MTTPGGPGEQWWEQPPSRASEPPPIEHRQAQPGYGAQPPAYPPQSGYGQPPGAPLPPSSGYPPPAPYQSGYGYPSPPQERTNGLAIGSLVASVAALPLSFCYIGFVAAIAGIVLGIIALNQLKTSGEKGRGLAIAGIVVGAVYLVLIAILVVAFGIYAVNNPS
jgi:hypothetical protein